jgi:hypothetical protein
VKKVAAAWLILILTAFTARADIIYFKDGLKTFCQEKAWEEDGQIKCEYGGWIINYQKSDILRILKTTPPIQTAPPEKKPKGSKTIEPEQGVPKKIAHPKVKGLAFYDPRRPYKYWSDKGTKHKNYNDAIQALAIQYNRPPEWIQANMGDSNNLAEIHRNLADPDVNQTKTIVKPSVTKHPEVEFYSPRRPFPYWTDVSTKHKSYREAIQALSQKYGHSPEWIKQNMGQTNDLSEIHQNLQNRHSAENAS